MVRVARHLNMIASSLHPGSVNIAFTYVTSSTPELAYLLRHDGTTSEITEADGPLLYDGEEYRNPSELINQLLATFPNPAEAVSSGFATTDDGVLYQVISRRALVALQANTD